MKVEKRFKKIYIEISNVCNLKCSFCPGTTRESRYMSIDEFRRVIEAIRPYTGYIYYHLMGEPLMHPELGKFIDIAYDNGLKSCITTNGTLLESKGNILSTRVEKIHKINISLQAQEANGNCLNLDKYLSDCLFFIKELEGKTIEILRLWNNGGQNSNNPTILEKIHQAFPGEWVKHPFGETIGEQIFLEYGDKFDWPNENSAIIKSNQYYCYGLKDQIGILADGTVVPCCLDNNGTIALGNIFENDLKSILNAEKALKIYESFKQGKAAEELCKKCGYATRFQK